MLIIVSDVAIDLLMDALRGIIRGVLTNIDVDVLVNVNIQGFIGVMTPFEFAKPGPSEDFRCSAAFDCRPMDCISVLQARMPSYHVR